jgi:F-box-like/XPA protein C-terminus
MQVVIPSLCQLDQLPAEIIFEIVDYLPPTTFLQLGFLCRRLYQVVCDAPIWEKIWRTAGLKKPGRKWKSYREVVLTETETICDRCFGKSKALGSNSPIKIMDTDDNLMISLCCQCRRDYYDQHPEPYGEEQVEGSTQAQRYPRITKMRAKSDYRLTDDELEGISVDYARNPHYSGAAPMCLYDKKQVVQMARVVHGGDIGIEAARSSTLLKGTAMIESRRRNKEARRTRLEARLAEANLTNLINHHMCEHYIASSRGGDLETIVITLQAEEERLQLIENRKLELNAAMTASGIANARHHRGYLDYVNYGNGSIEGFILQARRQEEVEKTKEVRRQELSHKLTFAGLTLRSDSRLCQQYIDSATGNADNIVVTMKEMDWFFRCTSYATSRKVFYDSYGDSDYDTDDDYRGDWWMNDRGWSQPRRRYNINSDRGKDEALDNWLTKRINRRVYRRIDQDPNDEFRPPSSLWPTINEKWQRATRVRSVQKLTPHYRKYYQNFMSTASSGVMSLSER